MASNFAADIIPLGTFVANGLQLAAELPDKETAAALQATIEFGQRLWNEPCMERVRDKIQVGLIKDTKLYGNTSVSMGAATEKLDGKTDMVGLLNCGTGGIKYQLYAIKGGYMCSLGEHKPKDGANPGNLQVAGYKPETQVSMAANKLLLAAELAAFHDKCGAHDVPKYVFVTGLIREHWEKANDDTRAIMNDAMKEMFEGLQPLGESYFMPQSREGELELTGTQKMYSQIVAAGELAGADVVSSLGIGRGSTQYGTATPDGKQMVVEVTAGMSNRNKLKKMPREAAYKLFSDDEARESHLAMIAAANMPVIALKSGAALYIDSNPDIKARLCRPIADEAAKLRQQVAELTARITAARDALADSNAVNLHAI